MLKIEGRLEVKSDGLFESREGLGAHEVVIETPMHDQPLHALDADRHRARVVGVADAVAGSETRFAIRQRGGVQESRPRRRARGSITRTRK
jgi:hypothetical protein